MIFQNYKETAERPHFLEGEFLLRYKFVSQFTRGKNVLDIGTGLGLGAYYIASKGAKKVLGIDYSKSSINYARKNFSLPTLEFKVANAINLSLAPDSFDIIIAFGIIEHLSTEYHANFLKNINQALKGKGTFFISTPNKLVVSPGSSKLSNPYHKKEYEPKELNDLLRKYFSKVSLRGVRCTNENYLAQSERIKQLFRRRLAQNLNRYKLII